MNLNLVIFYSGLNSKALACFTKVVLFSASVIYKGSITLRDVLLCV